MIVACPSCRARFKVADEKIGPQGAKVRCSKCQKVFGVQRDAAAPPRPGRAGPPSPDLDREPAARPSPPPFAAVAPPEDPFAPTAAPAPAPARPGSPPPPPDDPFAAFHQASAAPVSPPVLPKRSPPPAAFPSFDQAGTADLLAAPPAPAAAIDPAAIHPAFDDGLALEEPTARPPRSPPRSTAPPADGWLGELAGGELQGSPGDVPSFPDVIPDGAATFDTASFSAPFPSASIAIQTGTIEQSAPRTALEEVTARRRAAVAAGPAVGPGRGARLRVALVDTFALAVLLLAALALAAVWRGGPSPIEALRPASLLAVLTHQSAVAGPYEASEIQSAFYERRRGPPLLFVRGLVTSRAAAPTGPVRVSVDVVRDGQVVAHLEGRAGGPLGPEALAQVEDAASLARLAEAAAAAAPASFAPGQTLPFLVALADVPPGLEGAAVRVSADAEGPR